MRELLIAVPTQGSEGMRDVVANVFSKAPTFTYLNVVNGKVEGVDVEENTVSKLKQGTGPMVAKNLRDRGVDAVITGELGPGASTLLDMSGIRAISVEPGTRVSKALKRALGQIESP
jgi:predicted Fe-Mo cluster-binding NifX family protein